MCPVAGVQLGEQSSGMGFDRLLGQDQLSPDLTVRAALAHSQQDLQLPVGQRDTGVAGGPGNVPRGPAGGGSAQGP